MRDKDTISLQKIIEEMSMNQYGKNSQSDWHDLAKQDSREAYPHEDDMEEFENETEEDLYEDEGGEDCPCGEDDEDSCSCGE